MAAAKHRILVTGGATFMGKHIAAALLAEGASTSLLVRPGALDQIGSLADEVLLAEGDAWNPASLKGRARRTHTVIHTVGGTQADPSTGLTYHYLNVISLRNVADMCISDGVRYLILISAADAPWLPRQYIRSKREAERYLKRVGLNATVIRAPLLYQRGQPRPFVYRLVSLTARLTPLFWRNAPLPVDVFARGVARLALAEGKPKPRYFARDLIRLNTRAERRGAPIQASPALSEPPPEDEDTRPNPPVG